MDNRMRSIVEELSSYVPPKSKDVFIEGRAQQVIASARNLIQLVEQSYSPEIAEDLTKRLLSAIKNDDSEKFCRKVRQVRQIREGNK
jgi:uncharacterized protein (UPF0305 family)